MLRPRLRPWRGALLLASALALSACGGTSTASNNGAASGDGNTASTKTGGLLAKTQPAPVLSGDAIGGGTISTAADLGRVTVVNFYASWCAPCRAETPLLEQTARAEPDVAFLGVLFKDSAPNGAAFRRTYGVSYPSLVDTDGVDLAKFRNVDPSAVPVTFVLDKQGRVAARYVGGITASSGFQAVLAKLQAAPA